MEALKLDKRYTYADYVNWDTDTRYELIDGIPYAMASPSQNHQRVSRQLILQLGLFLAGKKCELFHAPSDVRLNADTTDDIVVVPDLYVVCDESKLDGQSCVGAPDFIIEILSPSTTRHDTLVKYRAYKKAGVREYWIVDPINKIVHSFILKDSEYKFSIYDGIDTIPVHVLEGCQIDLKEIFI